MLARKCASRSICTRLLLGYLRDLGLKHLVMCSHGFNLVRQLFHQLVSVNILIHEFFVLMGMSKFDFLVAEGETWAPFWKPRGGGGDGLGENNALLF